MCGIAGIVNLRNSKLTFLKEKLDVMSSLLEHRGPDDKGIWISPDNNCGLAHRRLSVIDLSKSGRQPMCGENKAVITFNGEIYNYIELESELKKSWNFITATDTETILASYEKYKTGCLEKLRGMFSFAIWDERKKSLFCARDRFGIKPFYYTVIDNNFYFASEIKALIPFLPEIETDMGSLAEYFTFQFTLGENSLFSGVKQLLPGHCLCIKDGTIDILKYWDIHYEIDFEHRDHFFTRRLVELVDDSVQLHLRSDVPVGSYLSGGIDSSLIAILASQYNKKNKDAFHGKFIDAPEYDESYYAKIAAEDGHLNLFEIEITAQNFLDNINNVIYHLDFPVAGPGSFPQYLVSNLASQNVKVVLGGQGGDEIFGGYARYLLAYFEQCIKAAIDDNYKDGNYIVTIESIIPNLPILQEYKPLIQNFWCEDIFEKLDKRYLRLIDRSSDINDEINWMLLDRKSVYDSFSKLFNSEVNVEHEAYFDSMTHFDFKTLLPALLHVEDRMSMAHGLESRVPLLDHPLVEFLATVPADIKFEGGRLKRLIKKTYLDTLPSEIINRRDKMGFPVPLKEWVAGPLKEFVEDTMFSEHALNRDYINKGAIKNLMNSEEKFSRKLWGLLCLEIWQTQFHDRKNEYKSLVKESKIEHWRL